MKVSSGSVLAIVLVLLLGAFELWQFREQRQYQQALEQQLVEMNARMETMESALAKARSQVDELENSSIGGLIDNANDALIQGWSAMMSAVQRELSEAQKTFEKRRETHSSKEQSTKAKPTEDGAATPGGEGKQSGDGPL